MRCAEALQHFCSLAKKPLPVDELQLDLRSNCSPAAAWHYPAQGGASRTTLVTQIRTAWPHATADRYLKHIQERHHLRRQPGRVPARLIWRWPARSMPSSRELVSRIVPDT